MMRFNSLALKAKHFQSFTGFKVAEFTSMAETIKADWEELRRQSFKQERLRKVGGGSKLKLPDLENRLLIYCVYAKLYLPYSLLEYLFGVDESTICRIVTEITKLLGKKIIVQRGGKRISTLEELKEVFPDLDEVLIDTTEQKINRPEKKRVRKKPHSGKKKDFTIKTQIIGTRQKLVLHVADSSPGRVHDYKYFQTTGVGEWLEANPEIKARVDLGYLGANDDYPSADIVLPVKRTRAKTELSRSEKIMNTKKAKARIPVENLIANLKKFKILGDKYRNLKEHYSATFKSIAFLSNFRTLERLPA
jgi:hypothetical protein